MESRAGKGREDTNGFKKGSSAWDLAGSSQFRPSDSRMTLAGSARERTLCLRCLALGTPSRSPSPRHNIDKGTLHIFILSISINIRVTSVNYREYQLGLALGCRKGTGTV